jgi:O-antigen ligase
MKRMLYVYKSMNGKLQNEWRSTLIFILMIIMMASLFFSRAALSISCIAFFLVSFFHPEPQKQIRQFLASPLLWGMSLLFFLPLISGLWSDDKTEWQRMMLIKVPLFLLPLAFAGPVKFTIKQWEWLAFVFIVLITGASVWSMFHYVNNVSEVNEGYLRAKSLITPFENDHVRFSWLICAAVLLSGWMCFQKQKEREFWILAIVAGWLIIYLHILAARTGLISFYIMLAGFVAWLIAKRLKWTYSISLLLILVVLPFIAYNTLPTFHNRVKYFIYDFEYFKKAHYLPGANDAVRVISLKAGWNVMNEQPLTGAGFGDVLSKTKKWYSENYPQMLETDKIYPSGEWVMYGAGCGWPGIFLFSFAMAIPFWIKTSNRLLWCLLNGTAAFSLLFDIGLEVQFGVFIYSFVVLWWWKWLQAEKM